jgi:hypothetical protein
MEFVASDSPKPCAMEPPHPEYAATFPTNLQFATVAALDVSRTGVPMAVVGG